MTNEHLDATFPMPFSGINRSIRFRTNAHLSVAVQFFARGCYKGHGHHYAVASDDRTIFTTEAGIKCLSNTISPHKVIISRYNDRKTNGTYKGLHPIKE